MSIDLTGPDEQDWLGGEEAPPIRYSELTTDEERDSAVIEQLEEPLAEVLSEWFSDRGFVTASYSPTKTKLAARTVLGWYEEADESQLITEIFDSVEKPETDDSGWLDRYLRDVAEAVVQETPNGLLEFIGSKLSVQDTNPSQTKESQISGTAVDLRAIGNITQNRRLE